jgi:hypothetical protein
MVTADFDPILDAFDHAPVGEEDLSAEEVAEVNRRAAELESGRVDGLVQPDVQRILERLARKAG